MAESAMLNTQLFRGVCAVASYPSWNLKELFKLAESSIEPDTTEINIANPARAGLPDLDAVVSTSALNITGDAVDFSPEAAAVILYGSTENTPSGTVTDEAQRAYINRIIKLDNMPLTITSVTSDPAGTTYTSGVDYSITPIGLKILPNGALADDITSSGTIETGDTLPSLPILITYAYPEVDLIKPFTTGQKFYRVAFGQTNEGGNQEKRRTLCFYCKITLNGGLPLNSGTEFGTVPVQIKLMPDPDITDEGEAAMYTQEVQRVTSHTN